MCIKQKKQDLVSLAFDITILSWIISEPLPFVELDGYKTSDDVEEKICNSVARLNCIVRSIASHCF